MAGKRPYQMGKRQAAVDETKRRILEAAVVEYQINGVADTSMQAVARTADVAPGTVLYHYPTPEQLATAVVEGWIKDMEAPSQDSIDQTDPLERRIAALIRELFGLYERSEKAYRIYQKSSEHPVFKKYEAWWYDNVGQMTMRTLGDRAEEVETTQVISVLTDPGFRGTMLDRGIPERRVVEITTELAVSWLAPD